MTSVLELMPSLAQSPTVDGKEASWSDNTKTDDNQPCADERLEMPVTPQTKRTFPPAIKIPSVFQVQTPLSLEPKLNFVHKHPVQSPMLVPIKVPSQQTSTEPQSPAPLALTRPASGSLTKRKESGVTDESPRPNKRHRTSAIGSYVDADDVSDTGDSVASSETGGTLPAMETSLTENSFEEFLDGLQQVTTNTSTRSGPAECEYERGDQLRDTCLGEIYKGTDSDGKSVCIKRANPECLSHEYEVTMTKRPFGFQLEGPCVKTVEVFTAAEKLVDAGKLICGSSIVSVNGKTTGWIISSTVPPRTSDILKGDWLRLRGTNRHDKVHIDMDKMEVAFNNDLRVPLGVRDGRYHVGDYELVSTLDKACLNWERLRWTNTRMPRVIGGRLVKGAMVKVKDYEDGLVYSGTIAALRKTDLDLEWKKGGVTHRCTTSRARFMIWRRPVMTKDLLREAELPCRIVLRSPNVCLRKDGYGRDLDGVHPSYCKPQLVRENFEEECRIHEHLSSKENSCPFLVKFLGAFDSQDGPCCSIQMINGGDLFDHVAKSHEPGGMARLDNVKWQGLSKRWFTQMLECIAWMHKNNFAHLDISLENAMLTKTNEIRMIDLGVALDYNSKVTVSNVSSSSDIAISGDYHHAGMRNGHPCFKHAKEQLYIECREGAWRLVDTIGSPLLRCSTKCQRPPDQGWSVVQESTASATEVEPVVSWINPRGFRSDYYVFPNSGSNTKVGKMGYMSPEIWDEKMFDGRKADVWSLGVSLMSILAGAPPFEKACKDDNRFNMIFFHKRLRMIFKAWGLDKIVPSLAVDLLQKIFSPEDERPLTDEIFRHPWLAVAGASCLDNGIVTDAGKAIQAVKAEIVMLQERGFWEHGYNSSRFAALRERLERLTERAKS